MCYRHNEAGLPCCAAAAQRRRAGPEGITTAGVGVAGGRILLVGDRCRFAGGDVAHGVEEPVHLGVGGGDRRGGPGRTWQVSVVTAAYAISGGGGLGRAHLEQAKQGRAGAEAPCSSCWCEATCTPLPLATAWRSAPLTGAFAGPLVLSRLPASDGHARLVSGAFGLRGLVDLTLASVTELPAALGALVAYGLGTSTGNVSFSSLGRKASQLGSMCPAASAAAVQVPSESPYPLAATSRGRENGVGQPRDAVDRLVVRPDVSLAPGPDLEGSLTVP